MWRVCIVFKRSPKELEFDGVGIAEVDAGVPTRTVTFLRVLKNIRGIFFVSIPSRPPFKLTFGSSAEFEQLLPVFFKKVEDSRNARVLFILSFAESCAIDMNVQTAGFRLM